jgi:hypothetical protein
VNFTVPVRLVEAGLNRIEIMAFNGYSWDYSGDSGEAVITWQPPAGKRPPLPDLWFLAVGVNRYDNAGTAALKLVGYEPLGNLNFCARDARKLAAAFKEREGKRYARVHSGKYPGGA